jgi:DUF309 family protein family protein
MMDAELLPGFILWNAGEYLLAQEEFEHLWLAEIGARRQCLRGLIHAAMGAHYVSMGDAPSARSKLASAAGILDGVAPETIGLDLDRLRAGLAAARAALDLLREDRALDPGGIPIPPLLAAPAGAAWREARP